MSKRSKLTAAVAAAAFILAGQAASADMLTSIGQGEGEVSIVAWPGYIERGVAHRQRQALWRAVAVGPERPHVQRRSVRERAAELVGGVRGAEAARRQVEQGPRRGLLRPDLHR